VSLRVEQLSFAYPGGAPVLREVAAEFPRGRVTAVLGPNGAGKSTLLRLLLGLLDPLAGRVSLEGGAVGALAAEARAGAMAYVPQASSVAFAFSAMEVASLGQYAAGRDDPGAVARALALADAQDLGAREFARLSAGQQQRVTLARALAQLDVRGQDADPRPGVGAKYLLADEPVSAMDPAHVLRTLGLLRRLAGAGLGVVVVLHDLSLVLRFTDLAVVLGADGRVAAAGATPAVVTPERMAGVFGVRFAALHDGPGHPAALIPVGD
jgi:iron complex transport system ATP-binding protein